MAAFHLSLYSSFPTFAVSYSSPVTSTFSSAWFVHFVTSLYLCFSEGRVTVRPGAVLLSKILID